MIWWHNFSAKNKAKLLVTQRLPHFSQIDSLWQSERELARINVCQIHGAVKKHDQLLPAFFERYTSNSKVTSNAINFAHVDLICCLRGLRRLYFAHQRVVSAA
jgi:hypothetical protein